MIRYTDEFAESVHTSQLFKVEPIPFVADDVTS
jgi:hypothetical protein